MSRNYNVAVCGATGAVGQKIIQVLEERNFPVMELFPFASSRSAGKKIQFKGQELTIQELTEDSLKAPIDIAILAAGGATSEKFAPIAAKNGVIVIDNSSFWRMDPEVPLVVPEVNPQALKNHHNIIANPNCSTIQSVVPLAPLQKYGIKRIVYNTYQSVSGAGVDGIADLENGTTQKFAHNIKKSVLPQIDVFLDNGYTKEEQKMIDETKKILSDDGIRITSTAVRVPILNGHAVSINIEFEQEIDIETIKKELADYPGIIVQDDLVKEEYPLTEFVDEKDEVFVGRIRRDHSVKNGLNMWVVADNIRKGAATNSVQIAEALVEAGLVPEKVAL